MEAEQITNILSMVIGGGGVAAIIECVRAIRYRRQTKQIKNNEVKMSDNSEQSERIDLGEKYVTSLTAMTDKLMQKMEDVNLHSEKSAAQQEDMCRKLEIMHKDISSLKQEVGTMAEFLNGDYKEFKAKRDNLQIQNLT